MWKLEAAFLRAPFYRAEPIELKSAALSRVLYMLLGVLGLKAARGSQVNEGTTCR